MAKTYRGADRKTLKRVRQLDRQLRQVRRETRYAAN